MQNRLPEKPTKQVEPGFTVVPDFWRVPYIYPLWNAAIILLLLILLQTLSDQLPLYEIVFDFVHWLITVSALTACIVRLYVYLCLIFQRQSADNLN